MLNKKTLKLLTFVFYLLFLSGFVINVEAQSENFNRAVQLFNEGYFKTAMPIFKELLQKDPENAMLNFYYGAARTENGFFSEIDLNHLLSAKEDKVPLKINYYLGIQSQALNNWNEALKYYNKFRINTPAENQDKLNLAEKIQQCYNHENPFTITESSKTENQPYTVSENKSIISTIEDVTLNENSTETKENSGTMDYPIVFQVNHEITYLNTSHFKTEKSKRLFEWANSLQKKLDFSLNHMEKLRDEYRTVAVLSEKKEIGEKILLFENESYELKQEITQLLLQARSIENEYWQNASTQEIEGFNATIQQLETIRKKEFLAEKKIQEEFDTTLTINSELLHKNAETVPIVTEQKNQDELIYKIQIGAYRRGLPSYVDQLFKKLSLIRKIENYTDEKGVVVYTTGNLKNFDDAIKMQNQIRQEGVEDAFIVPYYNGKRITLEQAKKIEAGL